MLFFVFIPSLFIPVCNNAPDYQLTAFRMAVYYVQHQHVHRGTEAFYRGTQVVWYLLYTVEALLLFRFALKLFAANNAASFTQFIYSISYPFITPFLYVLPSARVGDSAIEWGTLLAMLVYWVVAWGIVRLLVIGKPLSELEAQEKLDRQDTV